ncbi:VOC family protein [Cupriavidus sp. WGtm5]|uniref:VOC family protein n=1 Tax=Cupriavidus TaxID=106589 RepID=UPI000E204F38|nr:MULTISPECIES: VOC family protein [Cupriavidus]MCO4888916.1 VOC family protein [Cupriavidus sp. WGtm5]ULX55802.1 bleomycin resistance protein [Cupriavidus taiwanensis]
MATQAEMFDHAVVVCPDLDAGAQSWQRLGFTLTPRGYHTLGSQNHCIMLQRDYLELLHVTAPSPSRQYYWDAQQRGGGCAAMSCKSADAFATAARLRADGWHTSEPIEFSRPVRLDDGSEHPATFRVTALDDAPGARYFVCEHRTPELLWRPEWMRHANGAHSIATMFLVVAPALVDAAARAYAELTGGELTQLSEHVSSLAVDNATLVLSTPQALASATGSAHIRREGPGYAAIRLRTDDLAAARAGWREQGVPTHDLGPRETLVPAAAASGVALLFEQQG